ncbi:MULTISPECIES: helix-turn-helix domain-containing protein [unclassified Halomonas]|uniref:helix-turn-helix domain-containing protein n=1 Tax=unclassified Halomonas TaxID=2609666 RepID=UPI001CF11F10|nr:MULTISPECIES: helix-turn-helix domain-containing protein [unclassified Halomonas]MCA8862699.1 helix-turn-helix domain-containing protein [Halomonas sp. SBBP1]UZH09796.1 helix-turn-helix domain-containing protein [Halomonas sp. BDJS001]
MKKYAADDREAALVALLKSFYAGDLTEGQLLRALRRDVLGLNQSRYATLVGISRRTLSDIEGDKSNVTLEVKNRVYRPLGLEVSLLPRKRSLLEQALLS